jgi:hypothetical protein
MTAALILGWYVPQRSKVASATALRGAQGDPHSALQLLTRSRHAFEAAPRLKRLLLEIANRPERQRQYLALQWCPSTQSIIATEKPKQGVFLIGAHL